MALAYRKPNHRPLACWGGKIEFCDKTLPVLALFRIKALFSRTSLREATSRSHPLLGISGSFVFRVKILCLRVGAVYHNLLACFRLSYERLISSKPILDKSVRNVILPFIIMYQRVTEKVSPLLRMTRISTARLLCIQQLLRQSVSRQAGWLRLSPPLSSHRVGVLGAQPPLASSPACARQPSNNPSLMSPKPACVHSLRHKIIRKTHSLRS